MPCTSPRTVGFKSDGKTISWSPKQFSQEYATFQLPCGKCIECRLSYAREWAIRCVHESKMHPENSFVTLTYADEHLKSPKLIYDDFQKFMKRLRRSTNNTVGVFVTGEYGEKNKRPHWHAIIFNWRPSDCELERTTPRGDRVYTSKSLEKLWPFGKCELGSVTVDSAGYCARYAAKKLVHGEDIKDYEPISKKSSKQAIGKAWLEKYYEDIFNYGELIVNNAAVPIPRYYQKWLAKHKPSEWNDYVTKTKSEKYLFAIDKANQEKLKELEDNKNRTYRDEIALTRLQRKKIIQDQKFQQLQANLKL